MCLGVEQLATCMGMHISLLHNSGMCTRICMGLGICVTWAHVHCLHVGHACALCLRPGEEAINLAGPLAWAAGGSLVRARLRYAGVLELPTSLTG